MTRLLLTLNAGSSSLKFGLFESGETPVQLLLGQIDGLGAAPRIEIKDRDGATIAEKDLDTAVADHDTALDIVLGVVSDHKMNGEVAAVGHRIVHGGPTYTRPTLLNDAVIDDLKKLEPFAPLHQPGNLAGVAAAHRAYPEAAQIACFDTAFHRSQPWVSDVFALPIEYYDKGVRRYGFHGLSYEYVSNALMEMAPIYGEGRVVIAHLGNGASMCALRGGRSVGSSMGFSALDGLAMGTRCGQVDPGVLLYLMQNEGLTADEISDLLYRKSGLLGLSGVSHDMRILEAADTPLARRAIEYFVFRIRRELGAMAAVLGGIDALVFCGGIGENSARIRGEICEGMEWLGLHLDTLRNAEGETVISSDGGQVRIFVIRTNEEQVIAKAAAGALGGSDETVAEQGRPAK